MDVLLGKMNAAVKGRWSLEQRQYLLAHHKDMYAEDIAVHVGRTLKATRRQAERMGCSTFTKPKGNI